MQKGRQFEKQRSRRRESINLMFTNNAHITYRYKLEANLHLTSGKLNVYMSILIDIEYVDEKYSNRYICR